MRSRRTTQHDAAAVARRRLELLSAELAASRPEPAPRPDEERVAGGAGVLPGRHARRPVRATGRLAGWIEDRLPPSLQGRIGIGAGHLALLTTVAAVAMGLLAWSVVRSSDPGDLAPARAEMDAHSHQSPGSALATPVSGPGHGSPGTAVTATASQEVVVDVAGKVRRPGIVRLPLGSRVVDALEAAGGPRRGADLTGLNLARVLTDGEQVVVGLPSSPGAPGAAPPGTASAGTPLVNLNTATQAELETLPGVGPVTATSILEWRTEHGAFSRVEELLEVSGIGDAILTP